MAAMPKINKLSLAGKRPGRCSSAPHDRGAVSASRTASLHCALVLLCTMQALVAELLSIASFIRCKVSNRGRMSAAVAACCALRRKFVIATAGGIGIGPVVANSIHTVA